MNKKIRTRQQKLNEGFSKKSFTELSLLLIEATGIRQMSQEKPEEEFFEKSFAELSLLLAEVTKDRDRYQRLYEAEVYSRKHKRVDR